MKTYTKNIVKIIAAITLVTGSTFTTSAQAEPFGSFGKWVRTEAAPTISGKRKIKIRKGFSISHNKNHIKMYGNTASARFGNVRMRTSNLTKRFAQGGCIYATGNVYKCAPDIVNREMRRAQQRIYKTPQYRKYQNYNNRYKRVQRQYRQAQQAYNGFRNW